MTDRMMKIAARAKTMIDEITATYQAIDMSEMDEAMIVQFDDVFEKAIEDISNEIFAQRAHLDEEVGTHFDDAEDDA